MYEIFGESTKALTSVVKIEKHYYCSDNFKNRRIRKINSLGCSGQPIFNNAHLMEESIASMMEYCILFLVPLRTVWLHGEVLAHEVSRRERAEGGPGQPELVFSLRRPFQGVTNYFDFFVFNKILPPVYSSAHLVNI